jgi:hypothetical protein
MHLTFPVIPAPVQPQPTQTFSLEVCYVCALGPKAPRTGTVAMFSHLGGMIDGVADKHSLGPYGSKKIIVPVDPLTVVRLGMATWAELGYPEMIDAYTKLMSLN